METFISLQSRVDGCRRVFGHGLCLRVSLDTLSFLSGEPIDLQVLILSERSSSYFSPAGNHGRRMPSSREHARKTRLTMRRK